MNDLQCGVLFPVFSFVFTLRSCWCCVLHCSFHRLFRAGNFCPVCLKVYRNDESDLPMVCCDMCDRWIHTGLTELLFCPYIVLIWKTLQRWIPKQRFGFESWLDCRVVFLSKTLYSRNASPRAPYEYSWVLANVWAVTQGGRGSIASSVLWKPRLFQTGLGIRLVWWLLVISLKSCE